MGCAAQHVALRPKRSVDLDRGVAEAAEASAGFPRTAEDLQERRGRFNGAQLALQQARQAPVKRGVNRGGGEWVATCSMSSGSLFSTRLAKRSTCGSSAAASCWERVAFW